MQDDTVRPSSIEGVKRLARSISRRRDIPYSEALDLSARQGGFENFLHARNRLGRATPRPATRFASVSCHWRHVESGAHGAESVQVPIRGALSELLGSSTGRMKGRLARFTRTEGDHLWFDHRLDGATAALSRACAGARVLQFMAITGLRPSTARDWTARPHDDPLPGRDHVSTWYDPGTRRHVHADEPYAVNMTTKSEERRAWARRHGWRLAKPEWKGMYFPEGGCELHLIAKERDADLLERLVSALSSAAGPIVPDARVRGRASER